MVDTRINTDVRIHNNKPAIFVMDKIKKVITLIEVGITSQENLQSVELEKTRKYDLLAGEIGLIYKCRTNIVPYVMTWDGLVTTYHKKYVKDLGLSSATQAYIQTRVLKKTFESISLDYLRGIHEGGTALDGEGAAKLMNSNKGVELRHELADPETI